ncbi:MAG: co-chaperone GroES [Bifidobacteriaceae bacterium]|jgi:chaperonin GroES|nr:co-chaperone GroES [Bifidobacteriaceae bacterium]
MNAKSVKNIKPLEDRVIIEVGEEKKEVTTGFIIPDDAKEKPQEGTVVAVGPGKTLESGAIAPIGVKVGTRVIYSKYAGTEIKYDGVDYLIISAKDILATL